MKYCVYALDNPREINNFVEVTNRYGDEFEYTHELPSLENAALAAGCDAIITRSCPMGKELIDKYNSMGIRYIACRSIGYDHIDIAYANSLGIRVSRGEYSPEGVADYAIMLMLMCCRRVLPIVTSAYSQNYSLQGKLGKDFSHCTIGVVGTGCIGKTVLRHLTGFGTRLLALDICQNEEVAKIAEYVDMDTILSESDIISLHLPWLPDTYHMINAETLRKMKDDVIIINTGRGELIDTDALIDAIESGKVGGAGLDVIENDGIVYRGDRTGEVLSVRNINLLRSFPNVILTNHIAFFTEQALYDLANTPITCLHMFEEGKASPLEVH